MQEFPADGVLICPTLHGVPSKGFANLRDVFPAVAFARQVPGVDYVGIDNARGAPPTAVLCFNDVVALGAMEGIQRLGLKPGIDFGVVGFNNIPEAAQCVPAAIDCPRVLRSQFSKSNAIDQRLLEDSERQRILKKISCQRVRSIY
jgi:DNA-binding LacI/PurR family transcriptional regulator